MTGREFRNIRLRLGLTQDQIGNKLDKERRTIGRWERGDVTIPKVVALAMQYLLLREQGKGG